jgi:hypothetical protein
VLEQIWKVITLRKIILLFSHQLTLTNVRASYLFLLDIFNEGEINA